MRKDKEKALKLRLAGNSYNQISELLSVPKSTLSSWLANVVLSEASRKKIEARAYEGSRRGLLKRNKLQTALAHERAALARREAARSMRGVGKDDLLMLGAALYWAEGYKRPITKNGRELTCHAVSLTNSDPFLVKMFLRFLREYCVVPNEKIKIGLRMFAHQNTGELMRFWQKETGIPRKNFGKVYRGISKSSMGKRPYNRLPHGVVQIVVADTHLFHTIMGYIEGLKKFV